MDKFNLFDISFYSLNLFSFILGGIWGLSGGLFRHKKWWVIVAYFGLVAIYYALRYYILANNVSH